MIATIRRFFALATVLLVAAVARDALAHRVNVFTYVEGDAVHVECSYSRSDRVRFGELVVQNAATGQEYLTGKTDEQGNFVFPVPAAARAAKADLRIVLKAGEGHQNDSVVKAEEYAATASAPAETAATPAASIPAVKAAAAAKPGAPAATATAVASGSATQAATGSAAPAAATAANAPSAANPCLDAAALRPELEAVVEAAVEKKIAPIRKMLLDDKEKGPGVPEIFGGIGWLVGLAGLAAWAKSRKGGKGA